jgi:hypothetical protein
MLGLSELTVGLSELAVYVLDAAGGHTGIVVLVFALLTVVWRGAKDDGGGSPKAKKAVVLPEPATGIRSSSSAPSSPAGGPTEDVSAGWDEADLQRMRALGAPEDPHEEATFLPCSGLVVGNAAEPLPFENENCKGKFLSLHRATYSKQLDKSGAYPHGKYFLGKKRIWEARVQVQFKKPPNQADLFFGVESEQYVPMGIGTKKSMSLLVSTLKQVVGNQVYHSPGDDPAGRLGPLERPTFVMPLWAFDQFIVTPEGETPPDLSDGDGLAAMGSKRTKRVNEFRAELDELEFKTGVTYTFCFWGISQWLDKINWRVKMPFVGSIDFDRFCGRPPVHVVIYTLKPGDQNDARHLQTRKNYYLDVAFWSSKRRPTRKRASELMGDFLNGPEVSQRHGGAATLAPGKAGGSSWERFFGGFCCARCGGA